MFSIVLSKNSKFQTEEKISDLLYGETLLEALMIISLMRKNLP
jgi:hypothetical protein